MAIESFTFPEDRSASTGSEGALVPNGELGLWIFLATVTMLFAGFTSAIFVRRAALDWQPVPMPRLLWLNTAVLLLSSATLERVRFLVRWGSQVQARKFLLITAALGITFLAGQIAAWRQLAAQGVFLASNPHSSFFYILTGTHALHLLGGLVALAYLLVLAWRYSLRASTVGLCTTYWHFLDGLWIYLFVVLFAL